ncbi:HepT-like ribonuclease domain-containing protein [Desulfurispira natronophila]|uniref:Uncharacterized protein with HEPN domain n=1 Tax=Desulfurispira natronophila TaxID=682562 RepID=A0A7W7Y4N4_9BACT|nr:HepT-like ribonuclease domain-containing protein [Desulfurispira natronophila]MBB5021952.1 uncharacterized protein with HEPN domain [Desulfurispira natronophila]
MSDIPRNRRLELFVVDILLAGFRIKEYTQGVRDAEELRQQNMRWDATIRQLEIVGEAVGNILKDQSASGLAPSYFRRIVNFRNVIAHGYFGIDADEVWGVTQEHLPVLVTDIMELAIALNLEMERVVALEVCDLERRGDRQAISYLQGLIGNHNTTELTPFYLMLRVNAEYVERDVIFEGRAYREGETKIPGLKNEIWELKIRVSDGVVIDWPEGVSADIYMKVCDSGEYFLLNEYNRIIAKWVSGYVPDDILSIEDKGYGDYIIFIINENGAIENWLWEEGKIDPQDWEFAIN